MTARLARLRARAFRTGVGRRAKARPTRYRDNADPLRFSPSGNGASALSFACLDLISDAVCAESLAPRIAYRCRATTRPFGRLARGGEADNLALNVFFSSE